MIQLTTGGFLKVVDGDVTVPGTGNFATVNCTDEDNILQVDGTTILRTGASVNYNVFLGELAFDKSEGIWSLGIGFEAGRYNNDAGGGNEGRYNTYIGKGAGRGHPTLNTGWANTGIGGNALYNIRSGYRNLAIGSSAMYNCKTGAQNFAMGAEALSGSLAPNNNLAIGYRAMQNVANPAESVCLGNFAGRGVAGNAYTENVYVGYYSGHATITGSSNIFIGYKSGYNQTTNSDLLIIDNQDRGSVAAELTDALIYGIFAAAPADQDLTFNANVFLSQVKSGSDQANAGAAAKELWKTSGHASLPDNVIMIGV